MSVDVLKSPAGLIFITADAINDFLLKDEPRSEEEGGFVKSILSDVEREWNSHSFLPTSYLTKDRGDQPQQFELHRGSISEGKINRDYINFLVYNERYAFGSRDRLRTYKTPQIGDPHNANRIYIQIWSDISGEEDIDNFRGDVFSSEESLSMHLFLYAWATKRMLESSRFSKHLRDVLKREDTIIDVDAIDPILPETETLESLPNVRQVLVTFTLYVG